ncbi:hypothetical protein BHO_0118600 (plasmid) [Borrelia hermsii YBT]|uniref:Uncharacterized protein n=1 Tax=Borrelia hermsii YBT TaxID=1313295 RepID=W5T2F9_BORHE|nr:hypothetical protein [Borrelia hermsii]AHH13485.1 hypothetical protein BHO_0118600 [Borrelia hermsii YBT]
MNDPNLFAFKVNISMFYWGFGDGLKRKNANVIIIFVKYIIR